MKLGHFILIGLVFSVILIGGCIQKDRQLPETTPVEEKESPETTPPTPPPAVEEMPMSKTKPEEATGKYHPVYIPEGWELLAEEGVRDKMGLPIDNQYHDVTISISMYGKNAKEGELPSPYLVPEKADALITIQATAFEEEGLIERMKTEWWEEAFAGKTETKTDHGKELWCVSKFMGAMKAEGCIIFCDSKTVIEATSYRKLEPIEPETALQKECAGVIKSIACG